MSEIKKQQETAVEQMRRVRDLDQRVTQAQPGRRIVPGLAMVLRPQEDENGHQRDRHGQHHWVKSHHRHPPPEGH